MTTMTDPLEGTRTFRLHVARMALAEFEDYTESRGKYAGEARRLDPSATGGLANAAEWLIEMLEHQAPAAGPRMTARANTAIQHLDSRHLRDVLNVLAVRNPAAVLAAIEETGA